MSIPVLVRSVGPEPSAGYYTQWTTFVPGYPKFKNQDTGVTQALYNGEAVEANLIAYRAHHLYFTGMEGEIVDRLIDIPVPLPGVGEYYDIPVTAYDPGSTGFSPDAGSSQGTAQPSGPARLDITVSESFALSTGNARVTPWMTPRYVQEREIQANRWANLAGATGGPTPASVDLAAYLSTQLVVQDFGLNVPAGAIIDGIEAEIVRKVVGGAAESSSRWVGATYGDGDSETPQRSLSGYQYTAATASGYNGEEWTQAAVSGEAVILVSRPNASNPTKIFRSTDQGATWAAIDAGLPLGYFASGVAAIGGVCVAGVSGYTGTFRVLRSVDYGQTWSLIDTSQSIPNAASVYTAACDGVATFVIGVANGGVLRSTDAGLTWSRIQAFTDTVAHVRSVLFTGTKFIAFQNSHTGVPARFANSTDGQTWTLRYTSAGNNEHLASFPTVVNGVAVIPYANSFYTSIRGIRYSVDHGDTWQYAAYPANPKADIFRSVVYDQIRGKFLFLGSYPEYWIEVAESPDFPPTSFRFFQDTEEPHRGEWAFYTPPYQAFIVEDGYGVRHEEVQFLVGGVGGFTPADAVYDEGLPIPGGTFTYRTTFVYLGGAQDDLRTTSKKTFGGPDRRGSDAATDEGAQVWTAAEVNAPSFGLGYQAEGAQGVLQVSDVRMRIHYRSDIATDTLPAKRSAGLSGVAESPSGVKVAVGVDGKILRKPANNPTWSVVTSGTTVSLNAVEWVGDRFVAVGMFGMALDGGADGSAWTRIDTGAVSSLWAIRRVPDTLRAIAVGNDDYAFERSRLGVWSA